MRLKLPGFRIRRPRTCSPPRRPKCVLPVISSAPRIHHPPAVYLIPVFPFPGFQRAYMHGANPAGPLRFRKRNLQSRLLLSGSVQNQRGLRAFRKYCSKVISAILRKCPRASRDSPPLFSIPYFPACHALLICSGIFQNLPPLADASAADRASLFRPAP